jgi:hypothetical protein
MSAQKRSTERSKRELALLKVKSVPVKDRTPKQKLERKLLHALYTARTNKDAKVKAAAKKQATELEAEIETLGKKRGQNK